MMGRYSISYGKARVPVYRVYARPLEGLSPVPESSVTGRDNTLLALEVDVEVFGDNFLPAYTVGDNSNVVATDSMKNYILSQALAYEGTTIEGFLDLLGHGFLERYPQMQALRVCGRELPFPPVGGARSGSGPVLFARGEGDAATVALAYGRDANGTVRLTTHRCTRDGFRLVKITGSSFTRFVRDEHTTLPERVDRPLYIYLDVAWTYTDPADMLDLARGRYVPAEQVRDIVRAVFDGFVSESIQHLVHEMGTRLLERFPQAAEVSFAAQNHTWDPVAVSPDDPRRKVYTDAATAYGLIRLTMTRD